MRARLALQLALSLSVAFGEAHAQTTSVAAASMEYKAGQVWKYKTAHGAEQSRIVILDVQSRGEKRSLVHIRIENLPAARCGGFDLGTIIEHLAVPEKVLRKSTTDLETAQRSLPESYFEAYKEWQKNRRKEIIKRPLAEVALPGWNSPVIVDFGQTA